MCGNVPVAGSFYCVQAVSINEDTLVSGIFNWVYSGQCSEFVLRGEQ